VLVLVRALCTPGEYRLGRKLDKVTLRSMIGEAVQQGGNNGG
jgi:hypothetical protein